MATTNRATPERARWEQHFAAVILTGNRGEIEAATAGALAALERGADDATAKQAGRDALRRYRAAQPARPAQPADDDPPPDVGTGGGDRHRPLLQRFRRGLRHWADGR